MEVSKKESVFCKNSTNLLKFLQEPGTKTIYPHQKDATLQVKEYLDHKTNPENIALVVLPTGCGKTGVAVLSAYALDASRVLVVTPSVIISTQIYDAFCGSVERKKKMFLLDRKIIKDYQERDGKPSAVVIKKAREIKERLHDELMIVNAHKVGGKSSVAIEDLPIDYDLVIVDEAHHYPAPTWKNLIDHFPNSNRLFLTATPCHKGKQILPKYKPCFELSREDAITKGIIRDIEFFEGPFEEKDPILAIALKVKECLDDHDKQDPTVSHQAMILTQTMGDLHAADEFKRKYEESINVKSESKKRFETYHGKTEDAPWILKEFDKGNFRGLIVVGKLLEGYDNKRVSVVGIARNVSSKSKVLFSQFVGRAVRKANPGDPVTAQIVSHPKFNQQQNFDQFDKVREGEDIEEEED